MTDKNVVQYEECIVGNIIGNHYWGQQKEIKSGTKHFRAGAKVYCIFMYGGMGHEQVRVMGKPRKSFKMIDVVIRTSYIKNFRIQKVYDPEIIKFINQYQKTSYAADMLRWPLDRFNEGHVEIKEDTNTNPDTTQ
jgi:hypothetical protein